MISNIDSAQYKKYGKGNGTNQHPPHHCKTMRSKPLVRTKSGCHKFHDCETCPLPVAKCRG